MYLNYWMPVKGGGLCGERGRLRTNGRSCTGSAPYFQIWLLRFGGHRGLRPGIGAGLSHCWLPKQDAAVAFGRSRL